MESEPDYITINAAVEHSKFNVVVMRWDHSQQEYVVFRCSQALSRVAAESLRDSWAAAGKLEVR